MAGVITIMRNISALCLVAIVAHGVYAYDPRFTMLLIPPFLYYYHLNTPGWVEDLPVTRFMARMFGNVTDTYGSWAARIMFIVSGTMLGLFLGDAYKRGDDAVTVGKEILFPTKAEL